uniref:uncharacterized protein K02A2.6-like n=1 Tax=Styela clava TaxID=7725 RepID=UPI00193933EC|nr:uncharacterized protein K02A2.6-like [Styela clava]
MIITGSNDEDHLKNVENVLKRLKEYGVRLNLTKCEFMKDRITFFGHDIDCNGQHMTEKLVEAIVDAPRPENVSQVRAFTDKSIPKMTAARLQRYAMFLASHQYDIEYRKTENHGNADFLSRFPLSESSHTDDEKYSLRCIFEVLPVTSTEIRKATTNEPILSKVDLVLKGWPNKIKNDELQPYFNRRHELSVHEGCLLWGNRVVIPPKLRSRILEELHESHPGIVKMKALARSYVRWPQLTNSIENRVKECASCQETRKMPANAELHMWEFPSNAWERIHVDFAGPFMDMMFLVVIDAYSKWAEVIPMRSITSQRTIEELRHIFARYGICKQLVSDNGPTFTSEEFANFMKNNGIRHSRSAPFHPSSNGMAERFVGIFKSSLLRGRKG